MRALAPYAAAIVAVGCGSDDAPGAAADAGNGVDASGGSGGGQGDAAWPEDASTPDAEPRTQAVDPCAQASCWNAPTLGACGTTTIDENFSSGLYTAHRFLLLAPAGVAIDITATRTGGSWSPTLVVHDEQGTTVHDGTLSHSTAALEVTTLPPGTDSVGVSLKAATRMHLSVFLTDASPPADAEYTLEASVGCAASPPLTVRGVELDSEQDLWVRYIAQHVVVAVPGTASERIDKSAYVTWWALKEGVLNVNNPLSYSNCSFPPDKHIGPVEVCPDENNAWQVGLSGVQAAYRTLDSVEQLALSVFPQQTIGEMLAAAAVKAGFGLSTSIAQSIVASNDRLRLSWLLRNSPIGFEAQYSPVYTQCFVDAKAWCFGTGWATSASFAPTQAAAQQAVNDLKTIFENAAP